MAWSVVGSAKGEGGINGATTSAIDTTGANLVVISVAGDVSVNSLAVSDNKSNTFTSIVLSGSVDGYGKAQLFYCLNPTVGTGHTFTVGPSSTASGITVLAFSGAAASSALDQYTSNYSTSAATTGTTGSITPSENGEMLVFGGPCGGNGTSFSSSSVGTVAQSTTGTTDSDYSIGIGYYEQTTATAINPTLTWNSSSVWGATIASFKGAGGGGATITGDSGSYTLTGTAATLKAGRKLAADSGTYNLTGTAAALKVGRKLTADSGTYTLTGTAVAFKRGYALGAESGTYTVSGTSVNLKAGRKLTADSGSYALTGTDVTLNYSPAGSYNLTAESGTYTLTGTAATLKVSRKLTADSGTYALTGTAAGLAKGVRLTAESGSYTLTGSNVAFARTYVLTAESGAYTLTGTSAGLTWSGAPVVEVPTNGGPSIYGKPVFREKQFRKEYEEQVKRIEDEKRLARILREDEEITVIMALMAA